MPPQRMDRGATRSKPPGRLAGSFLAHHSARPSAAPGRRSEPFKPRLLKLSKAASKAVYHLMRSSCDCHCLLAASNLQQKRPYLFQFTALWLASDPRPAVRPLPPSSGNDFLLTFSPSGMAFVAWQPQFQFMFIQNIAKSSPRSLWPLPDSFVAPLGSIHATPWRSRSLPSPALNAFHCLRFTFQGAQQVLDVWQRRPQPLIVAPGAVQLPSLAQLQTDEPQAAQELSPRKTSLKVEFYMLLKYHIIQLAI